MKSELRKFKAIVRNTLNLKSRGETKVAPQILVSFLMVLIILISVFLGGIMWNIIRDRRDLNSGKIIIVNAPDSWHEYASLPDFLYNEYRFVYKEHPYVFDVSEFNQIMKDEKANLTIVFEENNEILTFYPMDKLWYREYRDTFVDTVIDDYNIYLNEREGKPVALSDQYLFYIDPMNPLESEDGIDASERSFAKSVIPLVYFVTIMFSCMLVGTTVISEKKENNTLAAFLLTPISHRTYILGVTFAVWLFNLLPIGVISIVLAFNKTYKAGALMAFVLMSVFALFVSALSVLISVLSSNVVTSQTSFLPIFLVFVVICLNSIQSGSEMGMLYKSMPLYGQLLGVTDSLLGDFEILPFITSTLVTILLAIICIVISYKMLGTEKITFDTSAASKEIDLKIPEAIPFFFGQILRPLGLLAVFQLLALIPPLLFTTGEGLTGILLSLREVKDIKDVVISTSKIIEILMSRPSFLLAMALGYVFIILVYVLTNKPSDMGLKIVSLSDVLKKYSLGLICGTLLISVAFLILNLSGQVETNFKGIGSKNIVVFISFILMWIPQGAAEEIMFRGFMLNKIREKYNSTLGIIVSSLMFCLFHGLNPGFTWLALVNLILISILYALIYLKTNNLWSLCAMHSAWNFAQGNLFGLEVSGNTGNISVFATNVTSKASDIWTGGGFGPEGGLAVTIVISVSILVFVLIGRISIDRKSVYN